MSHVRFEGIRQVEPLPSRLLFKIFSCSERQGLVSKNAVDPSQ